VKDTRQYATYGKFQIADRPESFTSVIWFSLC
jgi:hypothetical protein